jgi:FKBP-type peptidyl-prolyl cis-trans isomerase 2
MNQAKTGDTVLVHYKGKLKDGSIFDESKQSDPLEFKIGEGMLLPDFEKAVVGMNQGESKTIAIEAERAYGDHRDDLLIEVDRTQFPEHISPEIGLQLRLNQPDGSPLTVAISELSESSVTLDANHPLAGKNLTFDINLVEIL